MIITTYSALDAQDELPITALNFPALKHFFQCNESAGATQIADIVGGVVVPTLALIKPDANSICSATGSITNSDEPLSAGSWVAPGTKKAIIFAVGQFGIASKIGMGKGSPSAGAGSFYLSGQTTTSTISDGTTSKGATAFSGGAVYGICATVDWTNIRAFEEIGTGVSAFTEKVPAVALTPLASLPALGQFANFTNLGGGAPGGSMYGFAVFYFNTLPSDIASAVTWMTQNWISGKKAIYPGWKGLS